MTRVADMLKQLQQLGISSGGEIRPRLFRRFLPRPLPKKCSAPSDGGDQAFR